MDRDGHGLSLGDEPRAVFSAIIEAWLEPILWSREPLPATERQWAFLRELGHVSPLQNLVRPVASAWIQHYLSVRTAERLETLELQAGDHPFRELWFTDPDTGEITSLGGVVTVSSIGANGLATFGEETVSAPGPEACAQHRSQQRPKAADPRRQQQGRASPCVIPAAARGLLLTDVWLAASRAKM